jgi:hypothetical protein
MQKVTRGEHNYLLEFRLNNTKQEIIVTLLWEKVTTTKITSSKAKKIIKKFAKHQNIKSVF